MTDPDNVQMKILVGTLYSGENEFEECLVSIEHQRYCAYEHLILRDLPKREAHRRLFTTFLEKKDEYDLLIKVDADMVLLSDTLFEDIVAKFKENHRLEVLAIGVSDFISGELINGLNTFRNTVRWDLEKETIFTDISKVLPENYFYDDRILAPAATHCQDPSPLQAFHYGVHRGLKSIQVKGGSAHWSYLEKVRENHLRTGDTRIGLAVLGSEQVYAGKLSSADADYTNPRMGMVLEPYLSLNSQALEREIKTIRSHNWGLFRGNIRRRLIQGRLRRKTKI